jgi:peptide chain release factor subunit 1
MEVLSAELVQRLARWRGGNEHGVITLYLNIDGKRNIRPEDYQAHLDALIRDAISKDKHPSVARTLERISVFVSTEFERQNHRGLAIFADAHDLWEVVTLPVPVDDHLVVNMTPHVRQLETLLDEYETTGVLLTDKQRARLLVIELGRVVEREEIIDPLPRHDDDKGDWRKDHVKTHAAAVAQGHFRHATQAMFDLYQRRHFSHLVLGVADEMSNDVKSQLHDYLTQKLVGCIPVPMNTSDDDIIALAHELTQTAERKREGVYVDKLRAAVSTNGVSGKPDMELTGASAVAGLDPTLAAIYEKRVETLLVSQGFVAEGWRCTDCSYIATVGRKCRMCGSSMTLVDDVIEEAVEDALGQKCRVEFCSDNADLDVLGRIGALLRY